MRPEDYDEEAVHKLFDNALERKSQSVPNRRTVSDLMEMARSRVLPGFDPFEIPGTQRHLGEYTGTVLPWKVDKFPVPASASALDRFRPDPLVTGMAPREFAGPSVGDAKLFPLNAISLFVALGGVGKTSTLVAMCAHVAAGKAWNGEKLNQMPIAMFFVEEDQDELNRKFGAVTKKWSFEDRKLAAENSLLVSLVGREQRLTRTVGREILPTGLSAQIVDFVKRTKAKLVVCDHLQGFAGGDLNNSDTATSLAAEANKIVAQTGAAVVFAAHTNKANIGAENVGTGFTSGSLAFENAARQVTGVVPMPDKDASEFGVADRTMYMKLEMSKNSYGKGFEKSYLEKVYVQDFHTVAVAPFDPPPLVNAPAQTKSQRLEEAVLDYIQSNPGTTKSKLDNFAGTKGPFMASKKDLRATIEDLIKQGTIGLRKPTPTERKDLGIAHQVKEILVIVDKK